MFNPSFGLILILWCFLTKLNGIKLDKMACIFLRVGRAVLHLFAT